MECQKVTVILTILAGLLLTLVTPELAVAAVTSTSGCELLQDLVLEVSETAKINSAVLTIDSVGCFELLEPQQQRFKVVKTADGLYQLQVKDDLDLEKTGEAAYTLDCQCCKDGTNNALKYSLPVVVHVVDEFPPLFKKPTDTIQIPESTPVDTTVYDVTKQNPVSDEDFGVFPVFTYELDKGIQDYFKVGTLNGIIKLKKKLDYEQRQSFKFNITVKEADSPKWMSYTTLHINVTDVDDENPAFTSPVYQLTIPEGDYKTKSDCFFTTPHVSAEDGDLLLKDNIIYDLAEKNDTLSSLFSINKDGKLCVKNVIEKGNYSVDIKAMQENNQKFRLALAVIRVTVMDVNDHSPALTQTKYSGSVSENVALGTIVLVMYATDQDEGSNAKFEFKLQEPGSCGVFEVETKGHQGILKVKGQLDKEKTAKYECQVYAQETDTTEQRKSELSKVTVSVTDVNDNPPVITAESEVNLLENATTGKVVTKVTATDLDSAEAGDITFSLAQAPHSDQFAIGPKTGVITLACSKCLDYGKVKVISLIVKAEDNGSPPLSTLTSIIVKVIKTKFSPPVFAKASFTVTIPENRAPGNLTQLQASDSDTASSDLVYTLVGNGMASKIKVEKHGMVKSLVPFDAEQESSISFGVSVSDGQSTDKATVQVTITDVNEFPPIIKINPNPVNIPENTAVGKSVAGFKIEDKDKSPGEFTAWIDHGSGGKFYLDLKSKTIHTTATFDRHIQSQYNMTILATDYGQPVHTSSMLFNVTITDSNTAPVFINNESQKVSTYSFSVDETKPVGFFLGKVHAKDPDTGSSGDIQYDFDPSKPVDDFELDRTSGSLTLKRSLNYKKNSVYTLKVKATDRSLNPKSALATVTVNVVDVAESPIWPSRHLQVYLTQSDVCDKEADTSYTKDVTVLEALSDDTIEYTLLNMTNEFELEKTTGLLVSTQRLKPGQYVLGVKACSVFDKEACTSTTVTVIIKSDSVLTFCRGFYIRSVNESDVVKTHILQLSVNKKDSSIIYSIVSGNKDGTFEVDRQTGVLESIKKLDRERTAQYVLVLAAKLASEEAKAQVTVNVLDMPDSPPSFPLQRYTKDVKENFASNTTPILRVTAEDPDENAVINYSIDTFTNTFLINHDGEIFLTKAIDYDTMGSDHQLNFLVFANDGIFTSSATVVITVTDENDVYPEFTHLGKSVSVKENVTIPYKLFKIDASDNDTNDRLTYSIKLADPKDASNPFFINPLTGQINVQMPLDRETVSSYTLQITVEDSAKHRVKTSLEVLVIDINDNSPRFEHTTYEMKVTEGPEGLNTAITINATDRDSGDNGGLNFTIASGNEGHTFQLKKTVSEVTLETVKEITWKHEVITLTLVAIDRGSPPKSGSCEVIVTVVDINDHPPIFTSQLHSASVLENASNGTRVVTHPGLYVTDEDNERFGVDGVVYSIVQKDVPFWINPKQGTIFVKYFESSDQLNREQTSVYNITVVARDDNGAGHSSNTTVEIHVQDVDDSAPFFLNSSYSFTVKEYAAFGTSVGTVSAKDNDTSSDVVYYKIEDKNTPFAMDFKSGELSVVRQLDASTSSYQLNVSASDGTHNAFIGVDITVSSVEDVCPFKDSQHVNVGVSEHQPSNTVFGSITSEGDTENITYVIDDSEWKTAFSINPSGNVTLLKPVNTLASSVEFDVHIKIGSRDILKCSAHVILTIERSNDFPPELCWSKKCGREEFKFYVADGSPIGTIIGQIVSRDNDTGADGLVRFDMDASPVVSGLIAIDDDGVIKTKEAVDLDVLKASPGDIPASGDKTVASFKVIAVDGGNPPRNASATVSVEIFPSSINTFVFTNSSYYMNVMEGQKVGALVGSVSMISRQSVSYSILSSRLDQSLPFIINKLGEISTTKKLDREEQSMYQFVVNAKENDRSQFSTAALVKVEVGDINDQDPIFTTHHNPVVKIKEGVTKENLITIQAVDGDEGENAKVSYAFGKSYSQFSINTSTGAVSLNKALDREQDPFFHLVIQATDSGNPPRSSSTTLTVIVEDVNDNAPSFSSPSFQKTIALKNSTDFTREPIIVMNATDEDAGANGQVFYTLIHHGKHVFEILPLMGSIFSIFPVLTSGTFNLTVVATDFGQPSKNATADVTIFVTSSYSQSPPKLTVKPSSIDLFVGMQKNLDLNISIETDNSKEVRIPGEQKQGLFVLSSKNRVLLNKDLTTATTHLLEIMALNTEDFNITIMLEVRVHPLRFDQPVYVATLAENHKVPYTLLDLNSLAEAKSIVPVRYSLQTRTDYFEVNGADGKLTLIRPIDREEVSMVALNVSMVLPHSQGIVKREAGGPGLPSGVATVTVYITDVNDNAPSFAFPGSTLVTSVPANAGPGYLITVLKAFDPDDNNEIKYSIASGNSAAAVSIDEHSGHLSLADPAVLRIQGPLQLLAQACDSKNGSMCDSITVQISLADDEFHLVAPVSLSVFKKNQKSIIKELSSILGYKLDLIDSRVNDDNGKVDTSKTDTVFEAYDLTTNDTISSETLSSKVEKNQEKINAIFDQYTSVKKTSVRDFSNSAVIALITVACGIFLASFVAIFIVCRLWRKQKMEQKKTESALKARLNADGVVNGGFKHSDPDEPLELDFDLDDSSLFEENVASKRIGDMKVELNKSKGSKPSVPSIVITRPSVRTENEMGDSSPGKEGSTTSRRAEGSHVPNGRVVATDNRNARMEIDCQEARTGERRDQHVAVAVTPERFNMSGQTVENKEDHYQVNTGPLNVSDTQRDGSVEATVDGDVKPCEGDLNSSKIIGTPKNNSVAQGIGSVDGGDKETDGNGPDELLEGTASSTVTHQCSEEGNDSLVLQEGDRMEDEEVTTYF